MKRFALAFAGLIAVLAASCSPSGSAARESANNTVAMTPIAAAYAKELSLVDRMFLAPNNVRHGGLRRIEYNLAATSNAVQQLQYQERVVADGHGRFALTPESVVSPAMTTSQRETFDLIQKQRESFFFSYRDFSVRDRALFQSNYRVRTGSTTVTILGRPCVELEIRRTLPASTWYLASVDVETGLVMRCTEFTTDGQTLATTEFVEFTLEPVLEGVEWFEARYAPSAQPLTNTSASTLGFQPAQPQFLPVGFQLVSSDVVTAEGNSWVRRVYGDGVESLFLLQKRRTDSSLLQPSLPGTNGLRDAGGPAPVVVDTVTVRLCQVGPWTMAEATRGLEQIFVVGKVGEADVVRVLQSAL